MELQVILNTFASDVFRRQADCDYISARANYRMRLRQQFLWSAHQAVEKYLKAILLFNGRSSRFYTHAGSLKKREFGHDLDALFAEVKKISLFEIGIEPEDEKFLSYLSSQGGANRYVSTSAYSSRDAIHKLDRLIWHIRRFCQYIPDRGLFCSEVVPGMQEAFVDSISDPSWIKYPHTFAIMGGELESVINREPQDPARKALVWANIWYGKKRRHCVTYDCFSSIEIPPNERELPGIDWKAIEEFIKP
ncbi:HEPN domain-containing protein [Burkholderiaceae bacterium DAT-1]|nr:HEPN domain-containing protein [Burkholderiaceae bacterium DAT-1]